MLTADEKKRIIDKVHKCLRLSKSSEPHEAAAALRQAQKFMAAYGITEEDLDGTSYGHDERRFPANKTKGVPPYISALVNLIADAFGVRPILGTHFTGKCATWRVRYFGPTHRVQMAAYAHDVIHRACLAAWETYATQHPHLKLRGQAGHKAGFRLGWLASVREKVQAIGFTDDEKLGTDRAMQRVYGRTEMATLGGTKSRLGVNAYGAGTAAGASFDIHRPMGGAQQRKLTHGG